MAAERNSAALLGFVGRVLHKNVSSCVPALTPALHSSFSVQAAVVWTPAISETRALWEQLFTDITQFDDYRTLKATKGGGGPEFTHKTTKKGLWLTGKFPPPADILKRAESLPPPAAYKGFALKADTRALWEQLFADSSQFNDYRQFKADKGGIGADFRHKQSGESLWLSGNFVLPEDIQARIAALPPSQPYHPVMKAETRSLWEQLFKDISKFDDFRQFKADRGGIGADFRHKESGEGLWLAGKFLVPNDIATGIAALPSPSRVQASILSPERRALWQLLFTDLSQFHDYRHFKAQIGGLGPDFKHKKSGEGLWLTGNYPLPTDLIKKVAALPPPSLTQAFPLRSETRALWELLFTDLSQFDDYRRFKADRGGSASDFRHKDSGEGLWLQGRFPLPEDILTRVAALPPPEPFQPMRADMRALWELLFSDITQFEDYRQLKIDQGAAGGNRPAFRHKSTGAGLCLDFMCRGLPVRRTSGMFPLPTNIAMQLANLPPPLPYQSEMPYARRALWEELFADPTKFDDFRQYKAAHGGDMPDFKQRGTGEGLWLAGRFPMPEDIITRVAALPPPMVHAYPMKAEARALWEQLFTDITQFDDFRHFKAEMGGNGPDFRLKESGEGLWLTSSISADMTRRIAALPPPDVSQVIPLSRATCALWEQLFTDFSLFDDLRKIKATKGTGGPDFRHKQSKEGLWLTGKFPLPADIARRVATLPGTVQPMKAETRAIWELLFTNISMFDDLRLVKAQIGGNCPDFRHKESEICLWLTGKFPLPNDIQARVAALPSPAPLQKKKSF